MMSGGFRVSDNRVTSSVSYMKTFQHISTSDAVTEWELRGCERCDPDRHLAKYGEVNGLSVAHVLLHDRRAAVDRCNAWADHWNESMRRGREREQQTG